MQLVIRVDLDKAKRSLPDIFGLIGNCRFQDEVREEAALGAAASILDDRSHAIGEWEIEDDEKDAPQPLDPLYRSTAIAKYARPGQIEVDRFAPVSAAEDGAYVQGWLFVPETEIAGPVAGAIPPRKPPQSVSSTHNADRRAGQSH
jgi:hypothetical protein